MHNSTLFSDYTDPQSNVCCHILTSRVAPLQEGFYFVNSSISPNNRFLWFYCCFPPAGHIDWGRTLGVADLRHGTVHHFPETAFGSCSPLVDSDGSVFWVTERAVCRRGPKPRDEVQIIALLPKDYFGERAVRCVATHLTLSADKKELFLDCHAGNLFFAGTVKIASGAFKLWKAFDRFYNHAQMHPNDPNLVLLAQDHFHDAYTGAKKAYKNRLWVLERNGKFGPLFPQDTKVTHEWWDTDGEHIYAINNHDQFGGPGIIRIARRTLDVKRMWKGTHWHAKDWNHGQYFVCDRTLKGFYRGCPSSVHFLNRDTGKEIAIISHNPEYQTHGSMYHVDPHPHFSPDGSLVIFTTTVMGRVDVAVTETSELVKLTS